MSENLVQSIQEMLKEETWTRATISNYTQNDLKQLTDLVAKANEENCSDEIQEICEEYLTHSKESIIALYLAGILSLQKGGIDNSNLETLVDIFQKNHKENVVHYLCDTILADRPANKFALKTLANLYAAEGNDEYWDLCEKIVHVDSTEADLAKTLAEHYESLGDRDNAIENYKKAVIRYTNQGNYNSAKEVWSKLVEEIPSEIDYFNFLRPKLSKTFGEYKTATLMQELYKWYKDNEKWDIAIEILKENLEVDAKDIWARKEITDCYRSKYAKHSKLEEYIKSSNLQASYRNVFEAINDFEKHISFDKGTFVYHTKYRVGKIIKLEKDVLTINFGGAIGKQTMSLKMAVTALKPLANDHIWVLKATKTKDDLVKIIKDNKEETLKMIIKSFDNCCDMKKIKEELVPYPLTQGEWTSWHTAAKKILESDPSFATTQDDSSMYMVREQAITQDEKLATEFKAQKVFFARIDIFMKYLNSDETKKTSEYFNEMTTYFTNFLKNIYKVDEQVIASYLVAQETKARINTFDYEMNETFASLYSKLQETSPKDVYLNLKDTKNTNLKKGFLEAIKMLPNWNEEYIKLFPTVLSDTLLKDLIEGGFTADVQKLVKTSYESFKDFRETVIYFFKNCQNEEWYKDVVPYEKQLITLIKLIELGYKEIDNHVNSTENKKLIKNACDMLFEEDALCNYMLGKDGSKDLVNKFYTMLEDIKDLDPDCKAQTRNKILEKYPDYEFRVITTQDNTAKFKGLMVTAEKLKEKRALLEDLEKVQIPAITKAVSEAREKGDLKENAEFITAKEKKEQLTREHTKLQEEISAAVVFDPANVITSLVSFGTTVTLINEDTKETIEYTILGPWESDPDNKIISYKAPLGEAIMDMKKDEKRTFTINGNKQTYTVKAIKKANF